MPPCFDECGCFCGDNAGTFDKSIAEETNFGLTLYDVIYAGIHWYTDKSMDDSGLDGVTFAEKEGVYSLWHKNDYCPEHELFHMKGLYVGKEDAAMWLRHHWKTKNTAEEMLIYFTFFPCENRKAKYIEQLLAPAAPQRRDAVRPATSMEEVRIRSGQGRFYRCPTV